MARDEFSDYTGKRGDEVKAVSGIYIICHVKSGKVYIGQAMDISDRWKEHERELNKGVHHNRHLQNAWNKYGADAFKFQIFEYCAVEQLNERETHYIEIYRPRGLCYNATNGGEGVRGHIHSDETRRKISDSKKNISDETRRRMSDAQKNKPPPMLGKKHSDETRHKLSESHKGITHSDETRRKMSEARKNISDETRHKLSEASKGNKNFLGKKHSDETRHKMSVSRQHAIARTAKAANDEVQP